jgi:hypothetical protein
MSAFFDESEAGLYFTVACYLFRKSKVRPFEKEWGRMLKTANPPLPYFRMSACNAGEYPFKEMDRDERDRVAREAIRIISKYAVYGHYVAVRPDQFYAILGKDSFVANPYTLGIYFCIMGIRNWADTHDKNALIGYFFESGCNHQGDAERFVSAIGLSDRAPGFRYASHAFVQKEHSMPTQAADTLAWHSSKNLNRYDAGHKFPRKDFAALLDGVETFYSNANDGILRNALKIVERHAGPGGGLLAKAAFRNDAKAFRDAFLELLERERPK